MNIPFNLWIQTFQIFTLEINIQFRFWSLCKNNCQVWHIWHDSKYSVIRSSDMRMIISYWVKFVKVNLNYILYSLIKSDFPVSMFPRKTTKLRNLGTLDREVNIELHIKDETSETIIWNLHCLFPNIQYFRKLFFISLQKH